MAITVTLFTAINLAQLPHEIIISIHALYIIYGHSIKKSHIFPLFQKQVIPSSSYIVTRTWCTYKLQMHCSNPWSDKNTCCQKFLLQCQGKVKFPSNKMCSTQAHITWNKNKHKLDAEGNSMIY